MSEPVPSAPATSGPGPATNPSEAVGAAPAVAAATPAVADEPVAPIVQPAMIAGRNSFTGFTTLCSIAGRTEDRSLRQRTLVASHCRSRLMCCGQYEDVPTRSTPTSSRERSLVVSP